MGKLLFLFYILLISCPTQGQDKGLLVEGATPNLYLVHSVMPKENYYSLGRMYNVQPKVLASYNNLVFEKGLTLGGFVKIPLLTTNFSQGEQPAANDALIPIYHIVQPKEGLYRISLTYNKVSFENLKKWNKLQSDIVSNGTKLIIGYLKVVKEQSSLAKKAVSISPSEGVLKPPVENKTVNKPAILQSDPEPVLTVKHEEVQPKNEKSTVNFSGGYFKTLYNSQVENKTLVKENGSVGTFKTTSGWADGKYYCFHNEASPGAIIKVTNNLTGKSIYAKVLDAVPDIKQNTGLLLRISNSAAEELGAVDAKFECSISYSK